MTVYQELTDPPANTYDIVYADPPWHYPSLRHDKQTAAGYWHGKAGGAAAHYDLIDDNTMRQLPIRRLMTDRAALFLWATCPRLDFALHCINAWGLHYRGLAYIWVKTAASTGDIIGARGPVCSFVKPITELVLVATTIPTGRVFPLLDYTQRQILLSPPTVHSEKPAAIRTNIVTMCGDRPRIELFARHSIPGWDACGHGITGHRKHTQQTALTTAIAYKSDGQGVLYAEETA